MKNISSYPTELSSNNHNFFLKRKSKKIIIFFAAQNMKAGKYNFFQLGRDIEENILFVNDLSNQWYLNGIESFGDTFHDTIAKIEEWVKYLQVDEVYTVGTSMGGYAAILYGVYLNANILSFAPEIILKTPFSRSKKKLHRKTKILHKDLRELLSNYKKNVTVIAGEDDALDLYFASLLRDSEKLKVYTLKGVGHYVPSYLTRASYMNRILSSFYINGKPNMENVFEIGNTIDNKEVCKQIYLAYIALQRKNYSLVELITEKILEDNSSIGIVYYIKGMALIKNNNYNFAQKYLATATLYAPTIPEYFFYYTHSVRMQGDDVQSLYLLNLLLQRFPNYHKAYYAMGIIYYKTKKYLDAFEYFNKAFCLDSKNKSYIKMKIKSERKVNNANI